jgi:two-component system sensor histidine kinase/response regulator
MGRPSSAFHKMKKHMKTTASPDTPITALGESAGVKHDSQTGKETVDTTNRARKYLIANVSHEIRTPLNAILGFAEGIAQADSIETARGYAKTILHESEHLLGILNQVLDYAPNQDVVIMHLTASGHTVDIADDGRQAVQACEKNRYDLILMDVQMPEMDGIEATKIIRTGESLCQDVPILALTANAEGDTQQSCLQAGMNDVITKPIRRKPLLNSINKWLDSCPGQASQSLCVPVFLAEDTEDQSENVVQKYILVAEDSELIQNTVCMRLSNAGYRVDVAENGKQAVQMCEKNSYDLILMDVQMPEIDGLEATRRIRSGDAAYRDIPIIGLTADVEGGSTQSCLDAGMNDVISKAARSKQFLAALSTWTNVPAQAEVQSSSDTQCPCHTSAEEKQEDVPLDLEEAVREFGGNRELVVTVIAKFLDKAEAQVQILNNALDQQDRETLRQEAHKIRGGAANLTAMPLARAAEGLEKMAPSGAFADLVEQVARLKQEFDRLKQFM